MTRLIPPVVLSLVLLSACGDRTELPTAQGVPGHSPRTTIPPCSRAPAGTVRQATVNVLTKGAVRGDGLSDACAFQEAVDYSRVVYVPAGQYDFDQVVHLPSGTRVYGDGAASLLNVTVATNAFDALGDGSAFADSVTVENLGFQIPADSIGFALNARTARYVNFRHNTATNIGLIAVTTYLPIDRFDRSTDPNANAGLTSESQLSYGIKVVGNTASGNYTPTGGLSEAGILLTYVKEALVDSNTVSGYRNGIQWWGGDGDPARGGQQVNPRWARNITIQNNQVSNTENGVWGAMGQDVLAYRNTVVGCTDVCLDAEGDVNTIFKENTARDAGHAVADVYHFATNVRWIFNTLEQTGARGALVFHTHNQTQLTEQISVYAYNNTLRWTGSTGVGLASKEATRFFQFSNNDLQNVIIDMRSNNNGGVQMTGNGQSFDRSTGGAAAIAVGNNYLAWGGTAPVTGGYELEVSGNTVISAVPQNATALFVAQGSGEPIDTWVNGNYLRDFSTSMSLYRVDTAKTFLIQNNQHSGALPAPDVNVTVTNNPWL